MAGKAGAPAKPRGPTQHHSAERGDGLGSELKVLSLVKEDLWGHFWVTCPLWGRPFLWLLEGLGQGRQADEEVTGVTASMSVESLAWVQETWWRPVRPRHEGQPL